MDAVDCEENGDGCCRLCGDEAVTIVMYVQQCCEPVGWSVLQSMPQL
jgi:hypothetical protein